MTSRGNRIPPRREYDLSLVFRDRLKAELQHEHRFASLVDAYALDENGYLEDPSWLFDKAQNRQGGLLTFPKAPCGFRVPALEMCS